MLQAAPSFQFTSVYVVQVALYVAASEAEHPQHAQVVTGAKSEQAGRLAARKVCMLHMSQGFQSV